MSETIKAQGAFCKCGKVRMVAATRGDFDRETSRTFAVLMEWGCTVKSLTIEEARQSGEFCFGECGMLTHPTAAKIGLKAAKEIAKERAQKPKNGPHSFIPGGFQSMPPSKANSVNWGDGSETPAP